MLKKDIRVGGVYVAKISSKLTQVRVDAIKDQTRWNGTACMSYGVTNLTTGRRTTFRSAAKFRSEVKPAQLACPVQGRFPECGKYAPCPHVDSVKPANEPADLQSVVNPLNEFYEQLAKPFGQFLPDRRDRPARRDGSSRLRAASNAENAMRITKKMLREAKNGFVKRAKDLCRMSPEQLRAEVKRCFPSIEITEDKPGELLGFMICDLIDLTLPEHWIS